MGDINVVPYAEPLDPETLEQNEPLVVSIDRDGLFYLNVGGDPEEAIDEQTLLDRIGAVVRQAPETPVFVKAVLQE